MRIADLKLRKTNFVIAEIGNSNGSLDLALEMIDAAIEAGANCVEVSNEAC